MAESAGAFVVNHMRIRSCTNIEVVAMDGPSSDAVSVLEPRGFPAVAEYGRVFPEVLRSEVSLTPPGRRVDFARFGIRQELHTHRPAGLTSQD